MNACVISRLRDEHARTFEFRKRNSEDCCTLTFHELYERTKQTSGWLASQGMRRGDAVAVLAENGLPSVLIDLALMDLGATAIQVPESNLSTQELLLSNVELQFVLATTKCEPHVDIPGSTRLGNFAGMSLYQVRQQTPAESAKRPNAPAIIFSSGTSGKIKMMAVSEAGIAYNAELLFSRIEPRADDVFLLFLPLSNYQQKLLIYGCILTGVNVCLTPPCMVLNALQTVRPTLFLAPPIFFETAYKLVFEGSSELPEITRENLVKYFGGRLRVAWSGMAPIAESMLAAYAEAGVPLMEAYGMTEFGPIALNLPQGNRRGSVGRPVERDSVEIGSDGEIVLRSPFPLTTGYIGLPEHEEREVFRPCGAIATGDIGWQDSDGYLYLRGRKKEIVITSGGQKFHPTAIESRFIALNGVKHAVLFGNGRPFLGLLLVVEAPTQVDSEAVQREIDALNGDTCKVSPIKRWHMEQSEFSPENEMLTRNLKLNRAKIAARFEDRIFS